MADPFASKEWTDYADDFRKHVLPKISESAHMIAIAPMTGESDIQFMLQIGAAIVLDKPIVLLVVPGRPIPPRLARVADKIIEADIRTDAGKQAAHDALLEFLRQ